MFKKIISHPALTIIARLVLGVVFMYSSWDKIFDPAGFAKAVQNYHLLPLEAVNLFAIVIPWVELVCGVLLLAGWFTTGSSLVVGLLLVSFMIALAAALVRGLDIGCGVFFKQERRPGNVLVSSEGLCPVTAVVADCLL